MKPKTTAAYIATLITSVICLLAGIWSFFAHPSYTSKLIASSGILLTMSGILQIEVSDIIERLLNTYSNDENHPNGAPSHINRHLIDNPDRPIFNKIRSLLLFRTHTAFWLILSGTAFQLISIWIPGDFAPIKIGTWWQSMNASEHAAWIQAIGSVVAICVAIIIPFATDKMRKREKLLESKERAKNSILIIYPTLLDLDRSLDRFIEVNELNKGNDELTINIDPYHGEFEVHFPKLMAAIPILDTLPSSVTTPLRKLLAEIIATQHWLDSIPAIQESGSPGFYRNNIEDVCERAKSLRRLVSETLEACSATGME